MRSSPRSRGWSRRRRRHLVRRPVSSPRSRGWSDGMIAGAMRRGVVPALAGVVPTRGTKPVSRTRRPRARGGGPPAGTAVRLTVPSSPRSRGWSRGWPAGRVRDRVVPALAGVVPCAPTTRPTRSCRPRARGWSSLGRPAGPRCQGRPRARGGGPSEAAQSNCGVEVVPALAGVVPRTRPRRPPRPGRARARGGGTPPPAPARPGGRRPRARGGGPNANAFAALKGASSPRSRGWSSPGPSC